MNVIASTNLNKNNTLAISNNKFNPTTSIQNNRLKKDTVSFGSAGISREAADLLDASIKHVLESSSMDLVGKTKFHSLLNKLMPEIMTEENFLNRGRESKVYRISDDYVAKIRRGKTSRNATHFYNLTTRPNQQFSKIDIYYGETLIRCGNVEILKNATPQSDFMHCGIKYKDRYHAVGAKELEYYEKVFIPTCSELPQESYDELAKGLKDLNNIIVPYSDGFADGMKRSHFARRHGCPFGESMKMLNINPFSGLHYMPDVINPNNILISGGRFKIVDKMDITREKHPNSLFTMLEPLLINLTPEKSADYKRELVEPRSQIYKKCLLAAEKWFLPLNSEAKGEYSEFYLGSLLPSKRQIISDISEMREHKVPVYERIKYIHSQM
ncbi:MAG: hypothetical protein NC200_07795 [Candidatus Gastranaerophilales bacterium]|nr:hypothetical protein [Candidatus Gastranaerophilales bacterium]